MTALLISTQILFAMPIEIILSLISVSDPNQQLSTKKKNLPSQRHTTWAPTSYKWGYNPTSSYPFIRVLTPFISGRAHLVVGPLSD